MKQLAAKLCRIYGEVEALEKEGNNSFAKYKYFTEGQMLQYLRPLLTREGIFIAHSVDSIENKEVKRGNGDKTELHTVVRTTHKLIDSESGESFIVQSVGEGIDSGDKSAYKAITGATKYFYMKNFGITDSQDPENDGLPINPPTPMRKAPATPKAEPAVEPKQEPVTPVEPPANDTFFRKSLSVLLDKSKIDAKFVIDNCHKANWIMPEVKTIEDLPEGKAKVLIEKIESIKEQWNKRVQ